MSQDDFISKLMDETFEPASAPVRSVANPDSDFRIMTQISRLPVTAIRGEQLGRGLCEFNVSGLCLHIPLEHLNQKNSPALMSVLKHQLKAGFDRITLVSEAHSTWLFLWDSMEQVSEAEIHRIFAPTTQQKAA